MSSGGAPLQGKVCMLGAFAVGKSSLVRRLVEGRFSDRYATTVGVRIERLDTLCDGVPLRLLLWDLAGDDDFATVRASYLRGAAGYILVVDASRRATLDTALALHTRVRQSAGAVPFVLAVNKTDLAARDVDQAALDELAGRGWRIHHVSARTGEGVAEAFADLGGAMLKAGGPAAAAPGQGPGVHPAETPADDGAVALEALGALDAMVLAPQPGGGFRIIGRAPEWAATRFPELAGGRRLALRRRLGFLESFLDEADAVWTAGDPGARLASGPFAEGDGDAMEATALRTSGRPLLLLRVLGAEHEERVALLQRARANLLEHDRLETEILRRTEDLRRREEEIALRLVSAAESRDSDTGAHVRRIGLYSAAIADALGWSAPRIEDLRMAAPMHDIGKIGIPDAILLSPDPLTEEQWTALRAHTTIGAELLGGSDVPLLQMACEIARCHHEWWDGSGYPAGLSGLDIPEAARIVAVADVYDALVNRRPYKAALPERAALAEMVAERGTHFDPEVLDAFVDILPRIRRLRRAVGAGGALAPVV